MFNNPSKIDTGFDEGTVTEVDPNRGFCKVKTQRGQNLDQVQWGQTSGGSSRAGDRVTPVMGDRVVVMFTLGYPLIIAFLPKNQTSDNAFPVHIDSGSLPADTGNFSPEGINAINDVNKPGDFSVGDRVIASSGGGLISILRGGSILLRSSRLAEVFISKWDDVVRIVSRNFEHFTDVSSDIVKNIKGRVYRYTGYASTAAAAKTESYGYNLYYGDVALAQAVKTNYQNVGTLPGASSIIFREEVPAGQMYRIIDGTSGAVTQAVGAAQIYQDGNKITLSYNQQIITIDGSQIDLKHSSGAEVNLNSSAVKATFSGHYIQVTAGGVQMG